jgi:hypothetical protein
MRVSSESISLLWNNLGRVGCCAVLLCSAVALGQNRSGPAATDAVEQEALKVLNDSDWAHTVKPSLQDTPCTYENPAFPDLFPDQGKAAAIDAMYPAPPAEAVVADDSEYLIRFQTAKPVQKAVRDLLAMGNKWSAYDSGGWPVSGDEPPTDVANRWYNVADMITVAVILKHPGPAGRTLFDYAFKDHGRKFPAQGLFLWPCAGLRTSNGEVFAHLGPILSAHDHEPRVFQPAFPRLIDGKPLIPEGRQKVEFRLVLKQRVFETTFFVDGRDVLDGSEKSLYFPSAFTDSNEMARE